jgi:rod shape-determining protein MreD
VFLHAVLLMTVYAFQSMIFPYLRLYGLVPLLLPLVSTGAAVYQGRVAGGTTGLFAGILCDVSLNEPVGVFTLLLTLTGIVIGTLTDTVLVRGFVTYLLSCAAVLAVAAFVQLFPLMFFQGIAATPLFVVLFRQTVYSLAFSLPIWFFARSLGRRSARGAERRKQ